MALALLMAQQLAFIAALALLLQFVVALFAWSRRQDNVVYRMLAVVTRPVVLACGSVLPAAWRPRVAPVLAFLLSAVVYLGFGFWQRDVCLQDLRQAGCERWAAVRGSSHP